MMAKSLAVLAIAFVGAHAATELTESNFDAEVFDSGKNAFGACCTLSSRGQPRSCVAAGSITPARDRTQSNSSRRGEATASA